MVARCTSVNPSAQHVVILGKSTAYTPPSWNAEASRKPGPVPPELPPVWPPSPHTAGHRTRPRVGFPPTKHTDAPPLPHRRASGVPAARPRPCSPRPRPPDCRSRTPLAAGVARRRPTWESEYRYSGNAGHSRSAVSLARAIKDQ